MFEDTSFQGQAAIGALQIQEWRKPFKWIRAPKINGESQLFSFMEADNIGQGELGDCWLLAGIAALANFPGHILNIFDTSTLSPNGKYTLRLYDLHNGWEDVIIDDLIPCDRQGTPLFAKMKKKGDPIWPLLLEKACAKFVGSYNGLNAGSSVWAWQVLTGQKFQFMWARKESNWVRWEQAKLQEYLKQKDSSVWRQSGMKEMTWKGPCETIEDDDVFFTTLATYLQANFPVSCAIFQGGVEEKRPDGLLSMHEYSVLQVVSVEGHKLVQLRNPWGKGGEWNGPWGDGSSEWKRNPTIANDLGYEEKDDGMFWMPWSSFGDIFHEDISICPATLPCPRNSQASSAETTGKTCRCPRCRQPYTVRWVLLVDSSWHRLKDGEMCFLCLRAVSRATNAPRMLAGIHSKPKLDLAPPPAPRRLEVCPYGAACYRRNPQHFRKFHPSLLPRAPQCTLGCGRFAASGFQQCCKECLSSPPCLTIKIPSSCNLHVKFSGTYHAEHGRTSRNAPVYKKGSGGPWLWFGAVWMLAGDESKVGGQSGNMAGTEALSPHLVDKWTYAGESGWIDVAMVVEVILGSGGCTHASHCDKRFEQENQLEKEAQAVCADFCKSLDKPIKSRATDAASGPVPNAKVRDRTGTPPLERKKTDAQDRAASPAVHAKARPARPKKKISAEPDISKKSPRISPRPSDQEETPPPPPLHYDAWLEVDSHDHDDAKSTAAVPAPEVVPAGPRKRTTLRRSRLSGRSVPAERGLRGTTQSPRAVVAVRARTPPPHGAELRRIQPAIRNSDDSHASRIAWPARDSSDDEPDFLMNARQMGVFF